MSAQRDIQIGQMVMVGFRGTQLAGDASILDCIRNGHLGGVWLCDYRGPGGEALGNIASRAQVASLIAHLQEEARLPLLVAIDAEGGQVVRLAPQYGFPPTTSAAELGRSHDLAATQRQALHIAQTLKSLGINLNLAPVVDLNRNPSNPALGRRQRCFSDDPHVVVNHARAFIAAHRATGVGCVLKHFPGQGSAGGDTHVGCVDVSATWSLDELLPFMALCREDHADGVLVSHVFLDRLDSAHPASLSHAVTTTLLRGQLGFEGVVFTDDLGMGAIRDNYTFEESIRLAIHAGADVILHANTELHDEDMGSRVIDAIRKLVDDGKVSEERIAQSYQRIMRLRERIT
jgi:beta-N-acetylhexosaminidase